MRKIIMILTLLLVVGILLGIPAQALTVNTNKEVYVPGDKLVVYGVATPGGIVTFKLVNPNNKVIAVGQVEAGTDGSYEYTLYIFPEEPTADTPYGIYTILVYDDVAGELVSKQIDFSPLGVVLKGRVVDTQGNPIEGATVVLLANGVEVASTTTAEDGSYTLNAQPGTYTLRVSKPGYTTKEEVVTFESTGVYTKDIVLEFKALQITIVSITHYREGEAEKPFLGVVREGEILKVVANVTYGDEIVIDANVVAYILPPEGATGVKEVSFTLSYDTETGLYVGETRVPIVGVDRKSTLVVKATWQNITAQQSTDMFILIDYEEQIAQLTSTVDNLQKSLDDLKSIVMDLQLSLGDLNIRLSTLESTVDSLKETVSMLRESISELKFNIEKLSISLNMLNASVTVLGQRLGTLESRVVNLEQALGELSTKVSGLEERVSRLEERVDSLATAIDNLAKSVEDSLSKLADNVQQSINALSAQVSSLSNSLDNMASTMNTNINNLKQTVDAVSSTLYATLAVAIIALLLSIVVLVLLFRKIKG